MFCRLCSYGVGVSTPAPWGESSLCSQCHGILVIVRDGAVVNAAFRVDRGQRQLRQYQVHVFDFDLHRQALNGLSLDSRFRASRASRIYWQPWPSSRFPVTIQAGSVSSSCFRMLSCSSGPSRTSTTKFLPSVSALTQHGLWYQFRISYGKEYDDVISVCTLLKSSRVVSRSSTPPTA